MRIIDRYIRRALILGVIVSMAALLPLIGFLLMADELDNVGVGHYKIIDAFIIIALTLPRYAHQIFPIGGLIGGLIGLGGLATHGELTAMRATGISVTRITWSILKAGFIVAMFAVFLGEIIAPISEETANSMRASLLSDNSIIKTLYGFWARDGDTFVNIREILPEGRLRDVYIYEFDKNRRLKTSTHATSAFYTNKVWTLECVRSSTIGSDGIKISRMSKMIWNSLIDPGMLSLLVVDPHALPIWELYRYMSFMAANGLNTTNYQVIFWGKIASPLVILVMIALAVPLLFGSLRKVGMGQRVFVGILIGIAFYIFDTLSYQVAVIFGLQPLLAAFLPSLVCLAGAIWTLQRIR